MTVTPNNSNGGGGGIYRHGGRREDFSVAAEEHKRPSLLSGWLAGWLARSRKHNITVKHGFAMMVAPGSDRITEE